MENVTKEQARAFWRDLRGSFGYEPDGNDTHGVVTAKHVAEKLGISEEKANAYLWACVWHGFSDRASGRFVI